MKKPEIPLKEQPLKIDPRSLTDIKVIPIDCVARTAQCLMNQGFNNFKILTLTIKAGIVVGIKYSDAYQSFEALDTLEQMDRQAILSLNMKWKDGLCFSQ